MAAVALLYAIAPDIGRPLARAVAANPGIDPVVRRQVDVALNGIQFGTVINYRIVIYSPPGGNGSRLAQSIANALRRARFSGQTTLRENAAFFSEHNSPRQNQIRFEPPHEKEAATRLKLVLRELLPSIQLETVAVGKGNSDSS